MADIPAGVIQPQAGYSAPAGAGMGNLGDRLASIISNTLGFITVVAGLAFIFYLIFGAINWITSAGDPKKLETARQTITNALIGLTITVIAYPVLTVISHLLGVDLTNPLELLGLF
ncbi:MAG: hypothetical protein V1810_00805 [Candidatus Beckwithbacteria bacterium]